MTTRNVNKANREYDDFCNEFTVCRSTLSQHPLGRETEESPVADDDMVEDLDPHKVAGLPEASGDVHVFAGGRRVTAGVVMDEDDRGRRFTDSRAEYLAGMEDALVQRGIQYYSIYVLCSFYVCELRGYLIYLLSSEVLLYPLTFVYFGVIYCVMTPNSKI